MTMDNLRDLKPQAQDEPPADKDRPNEAISPAAFTPASGEVQQRRLQIRPLPITVGALLVVSALVVWFLFTAKSLTVTTTPANTQVSLSGGLLFRLADHYVVLQGDYEVTAEAPGYFPRRQTVTVTEEQNQNLQLTLQRLPGQLTVDTNALADIWIDGKQRGQSGTRIEDIAAGPHQLRIEAPRYRPHKQEIVIEGMDQHQQLQVRLAPAWGTLGLATEPGGAQLLVDGEPAGNTPLKTEILEGERQLMLKLPGYKAWQQTLEIRAGEDIDLPAIPLQKADGLVMLTSTPSNASVTLNGKYQGATPLELALAPGQAYEVNLFKDGFQPTNRAFTVTSGQELSLSVKLPVQLGDISVRSNHGDALLYVDGRLMGRANQQLSLPARQHQLKVTKDGYVDYTTAVLPRPGFAQEITIALKTLEQAKWENIKPLITAGADGDGPQLKLFKVQQQFTMGSSRREQGRRSNEALRKVELGRAFYLGVREVTNGQFRQFEKFHSSGHVKGNSLNGDDYPVVNISWQQAARYCNWLSEREQLSPFYQMTDGVITGFNPQSNGYRLPTEAEWAWAARYDKAAPRNQMLKYPWGNKLPPSAKAGNYGDRSAAALLGTIQVNYNDSYAGTAPVGSFPANSKELYDLGGNVAEWINDFYGVQTGLSRQRQQDPLGPNKGDHHVIRGSSWAHGSVTDLRLSFRDYGLEGRNDLGFRIARYVE